MPESRSLQEVQAGFTAHIRNPAEVAAPAGIEGRRMKVYNDLVYNNIEGFLSGGFPVLHSLHREEDWHRLVRDFVCKYRCESPYFLEITQEFLNYLMQTREASPVDPPFMLELAHYEWVELALDVSQETIPPKDEFPPQPDTLDAVPLLSPLVWSLQYSFPVHLIGPGFEPDESPAEPTYLVVYRNREDEVKFMESNAATARLLELLADNPQDLSSRELLQQLAGEMNTDPLTPVVEFGARMLSEFQQQDILAGYRPKKS
jgi:hypothetical protein